MLDLLFLLQKFLFSLKEKIESIRVEYDSLVLNPGRQSMLKSIL